jgi:hypothetical protein
MFVRRHACTRACASLGLFDVLAVGPVDVRLLQVKAVASISPRECANG